VLKVPQLCQRVTTITIRGLSRQRNTVRQPHVRTKPSAHSKTAFSRPSYYNNNSTSKWGGIPYGKITAQLLFSVGIGYYIYTDKVFAQAMALQDTDGTLKDMISRLKPYITLENDADTTTVEYNAGDDAAIDIIVCVCFTSVVALVLAKRGVNVFNRVGASPQGGFWTPFTNLFIHGSYMHLFANMMALYNFRPDSADVTESMNRFQLPAFLLTAGLTSSIVSVIWKTLIRSKVPSVGASGAIYALVFYKLFKYPDNEYHLIFSSHYSFKSEILARCAILVEIVLLTVLRSRSPFDHACHLGGMLFGYVYLKWLEEKWWTLPVAQADKDIKEVIDIIKDE